MALGGLLTGPFVIVIAAALAYRYLLQLPGLQAAMAGVAAVGVGMLLRLGLLLLRRLPRRAMPASIAAATFVAVGILNWPLVWVVLILAPISIAAAWPRPVADA